MSLTIPNRLNYQNLLANKEKESDPKELAGVNKESDSTDFKTAGEYRKYLTKKYKGMRSEGNYSFTVPDAYLKKCLKDPKKREDLEKQLARIPDDQMRIENYAKQRGGKVTSHQIEYDSNGYVGTTTCTTYGDGVEDEDSDKKTDQKDTSSAPANMLADLSTEAILQQRRIAAKRLEFKENEADNNNAIEQKKRQMLEDQLDQFEMYHMNTPKIFQSKA